MFIVMLENTMRYEWEKANVVKELNNISKGNERRLSYITLRNHSISANDQLTLFAARWILNTTVYFNEHINSNTYVYIKRTFC